MRGKRLKHVVLLLAILAGGLLLVAQVPLHDFAAPVEHHEDFGHETSHHEHPARTMAFIAFFVLLSMIAFVTPAILPQPRIEGRSFAGPLRCDDDVGLHALLSVYRI